jgi:peptidoglycan/xylan/chitin deacetylase (PgdA/CDA1 family)
VHPPTVAQPASPRRPAPGRRLWTLVALVAVLAAVGGYSEWSAARPTVAWSFSPATNRIAVALRPGRGPLASWVLSGVHLVVGQVVAPRSTWTAVLAPGERIAWTVEAQGLDGTATTLRLAVPSAARISSTTLATDSITVKFSRPVITVDEVLGTALRPLSVQGGDSVVLSRSATAQRVTLLTVDRRGERAVAEAVVPALPPVPVVWFGSKAGRHVYITIDDGWWPSQTVLHLMQARHVPLTAFLIQDAVTLHMAYWKKFVALGGVVEDHTVSHPNLATISPAAAEEQWAGPVQNYPTWLGVHPTVGRPPYGGIDGAVLSAARAAGLRAVVMWSAEWTPGHGFSTWNRASFQPGEIILLHWVPGLGRALTQLLAELQVLHLTPAPLMSGLPANLG